MAADRTARQDAIDAMVLATGMPPGHCEALLDAIPDELLAAYLREQGGLEQVAWGRPNPHKPRLGGPYWRMRGLYEGDDPGDGWTPVFRLAADPTGGADRGR